MNARIDISHASLTVTIAGLDVLWTFRRRLVVPLEHVKGARLDPHVKQAGPWLGAGQTDALLGYAVAAGSMLVHGRHEFWVVHRPARAVVIDLEDEPYDRLVVEVEDPGAVIAAINSAAAAKAAA